VYNIQKPDNKNNSESRPKVKYPQLNPLWIGLFVDIMGFYIIIPLLPIFMESYNTTPLVMGILLATNAFFTLFAAPIWGRLSDKYGRRPVLLISQAGTFTGFLILTFSNSLELLFLARIIDGCFGGNYPMVKAIITDSVPPQDRGVQMTNIGICHVLAGLVAPGMVGLLSFIQIFGSEYPMGTFGLVAAGFSLTTIIITTLYVEESWPKERRIQAEKTVKVKLKLRENKDASYLLTQYMFHTFSFTIYITTLTLFMKIVLDVDIVQLSVLLTISGLARVIMRFSVFKLTLKALGEKKMTRLGLIILVISFFFVGLIRDIYGFAILLIIVSYGVSCSRGMLISKVTQSVSPKEMGRINGYTTTLDSIAQVIGPILGAFMLQTIDPIWFGLTISLIGLGAFLMVFKVITPYWQKQQTTEMNFKKE